MTTRLAAIATCILLVAAGCSSAPPPGANGEDLPGVEIREFDGETLSAISHFRENSIKGPQHVDVTDYTLTVDGLVGHELSYSYDEVLDQHTSRRKVVTLSCVEGWDVTILWEGILLKDLLQSAEVSPHANTVIFRSVDGYSTSVPLDYILDHDIVLAHKMNGVTLPPERGFPFQLVAESKWGYKWIKWVHEIEVSDDPDYRGYWESFGYSNSGDLDKPTFD